MCEQEDLQSKYKIDGDIDEIEKRSRNWDRLIPELTGWRERERNRVELESVSVEESFSLHHSVMRSEIDVFPVMWDRIVGDVKDDIVEDFISSYRMRYLFLFDAMKPEAVKRNKDANVRVYIDWSEALK